jgi:hypothetical protein
VPVIFSDKIKIMITDASQSAPKFLPEVIAARISLGRNIAVADFH